MNQLQAALQRAGISKEDLPSGKKDQKSKRIGKRSTGEITLRCLRVILLAEVARLNPGEVPTNRIVSALIAMTDEVDERLSEYEAEREAQQKF